MPVRSAVILGGTPSGIEMAAFLRSAGLAVTVLETDPHSAVRARDVLRRTMSNPVELVSQLSLQEIDMVFDALGAESHQQRVSLYDRMADELPENVVILMDGDASLHASGPVARLGDCAIRFLMSPPANLRKLVELSAPPDIPASHLSAGFDLAVRMGKQVVRFPHGKESISTRFARRLSETTETLLLEGAIPNELDEAMVAFGFDIGVFQAEDLIGLDVGFARRRHRAKGSQRPACHRKIADRMVEEGRIGKSVGVGWYRYPGGGGAVIDPLVEDLAREEAWFAKISQREIGPVELLETFLLAMIHEGAVMLADGTAQSAADIDLVSIAGLGFPAERGGVMAFSSSTKPNWIRDRFLSLSMRYPAAWTKNRVIADCLTNGIPFVDKSKD
jgi:3-hydroxyacyl-CoA dehydrogenase